MNEPPDEFETYLRQFRPRTPGKLPEPVAARRHTVRWSLAAAAIVIVGIGIYRSMSHPRVSTGATGGGEQLTSPLVNDPTSPATLGWLTQAALISPDALDAALVEASRTLLPNVDHPESTLNVLTRN